MSDLDYVYAVARIRVKEKSLLGDMDIAQMVGLKDDRQVLGYLEDKGWGDSSSSGNADAVLAAEERKTMQLMKELKIDPAAFELLSYPKIYHNLKTAIKEACTSENNEGAFYPDEKYSRKELLRILAEKDYKALPEHMRGEAERAMGVMLETRDGQKCDIIIDRACLEAMRDAGRSSKHRLLKAYAESTVAVTDIKIAVRALRTGKNAAFLKEALAPCSSLDVRALAIAASESEESLIAYLETHGFREAAEALKESPSAFERWCDNRLIETIRPEKMNSVSMGPIIAYYLARQNEIKTVRIILTGKANEFPEEAIRERVREMYV
ncbi:MAG: V-type ATPase subunit [Lachnospiraceae bacterium]|nr:V-type ATPase subunit [Lachnospiraceae bacterium]